MDAIKDMYDNVITSVRTIGGETNSCQFHRLTSRYALNAYLFTLVIDDN